MINLRVSFICPHCKGPIVMEPKDGDSYDAVTVSMRHTCQGKVYHIQYLASMEVITDDQENDHLCAGQSSGGPSSHVHRVPSVV